MQLFSFLGVADFRGMHTAELICYYACYKYSPTIGYNIFHDSSPKILSSLGAGGMAHLVKALAGKLDNWSSVLESASSSCCLAFTCALW